MSEDEVIQIMDKMKSTSRIPLYHQIYQMATGTRWNKCFCGSGFDRFYNTCKGYAEELKKRKNKNASGNTTTIIVTETKPKKLY